MLEQVVNFGIYTIYDKEVDQCGLPFVAENDSVALRRCVHDFLFYDDVVISDLSVFEIGQYDAKAGTIIAYEPGAIHTVFTGKDILTQITIKRKELKEIQESAEKELAELKMLKEDNK